MIESKVRLNSGSYLKLSLQADLVELGDDEWEFVIKMLLRMREYAKAQAQAPLPGLRIMALDKKGPS